MSMPPEFHPCVGDKHAITEWIIYTCTQDVVFMHCDPHSQTSLRFYLTHTRYNVWGGYYSSVGPPTIVAVMLLSLVPIYVFCCCCCCRRCCHCCSCCHYYVILVLAVIGLNVVAIVFDVCFCCCCHCYMRKWQKQASLLLLGMQCHRWNI